MRKLHGDGCCCAEPSEKFRVRPRYDYEKKHVSRDSKMCCCCCRFCCGAPTTDERIHAPVLEVAPHYHQIIVLLYVLRIVMLLIFSATLGGGLHWRDTRAAAPAASSRLLSYCQNPGTPPPQPTGRGTNTRSLWRPRLPMVANH